LRPETKARKWPLVSTLPLAETKHQHASPPIRGFSLKLGKSPLECDGVVADAVTVEPVSAGEVPAYRENYREFIIFAVEMYRRAWNWRGKPVG
jgi:hypothetical protein